MSTVAQATANLANAQHSTGPATDEGKAKSSLNSIKHGLTAKTVLLPGEDPAEYQTFAEGMTKSFGPGNEAECALVRELTELQWRLQRVARLEAGILSVESPDFKALNNISLHASRLKRQYSATFKELLILRSISCPAGKRAMAEAATIRRADILRKQTTDLAKFGFVFTIEEIDLQIRREDALIEAMRTLEANVPRDPNGRI